MCAINGITRADFTTVEQMNLAVGHRGPDGSNIYGGNDFTFGHNRLAIIDLSDAGIQPRVSNDGRYVIVFNGEIYNYRELREELKSDYQFKSETDTEVLLAAYIKWGEEMLNKLRGIFAFAIWDNQKADLLLVRDQLGIKPMYYTSLDNNLVFSSELNGLLAVVKKRNLNISSISSYLAMHYVPSSESLVSGIKKLLPGHLLRWSKHSSIQLTRYYTPDNTKRNIADIDIYNEIDVATKRQMVSDRPIGAFISGGLDSSIVLHHMSKHSDKVKTFSVGYEMVAGAESEANKFNADSILAKRTASHYGAEHTNFDISLTDIRGSLENILMNVDEPIANPTVVAQYLLSKWVREKGVVVALGGDGGDELFGGYTRHRAMVSAYLFQKFPNFAQDTIVKLNKKLSKLKLGLPLELHQGLMMESEDVLNGLLKTKLELSKNFNDIFTERYNFYKEIKNPLEQFLLVDRETWLPDESLARSDRTSMAHGLELRVPLLDLDVVNLADQISVWKKTWPNEGKRILRQAYRKHLPKYLFSQPKRGWISPGAKWLRDPVINDFAKSVFSSDYYGGLDSLFDWEKVRSMLDRHTHDKEYHLHPLWNILSLQIWARKNSVIVDL